MSLTNSLFAQNYKELVWEALNDLNVLEKPQGNNKYYFKYKVRSAFKDSKKYPTVKATIETRVAKDRIVIKSDKMDYYQDSKNTFTVVKDERKIFWSEAISDEWKQQDFSGFSNYKKSFYEKAEYSRVSRKDEPEGIILLKMLPSVDVQKKGLTEYVLIEINTVTKKVTRMLVMFNAASQQKLVEYIYEEMDLKSSTPILNNMQDYVMSSSEKLKSAYKNYELIDIRKESRNKK